MEKTKRRISYRDWVLLVHKHKMAQFYEGHSADYLGTINGEDYYRVEDNPPNA